MLLCLQIAYFALCLGISTFLIHLVISFKKSKPSVLITLSDMITCDLSMIFLSLMYVAVASFALKSLDTPVHPFLASVTASSITSQVLAIISYLLVKVTVEYFQIKLRVVDLSDIYRQEDVLLFLRLAILFSVAVLTTWIHVASGQPPTYYYITGKPMAPEALEQAAIVLLLSLAVSTVCLLLKAVTVKEKKILLGSTRLPKQTIPLWTYFIGTLIIMFVIVTMVGSFIVNDSDVHSILRHFYFGILSVMLPFILISRNRSLRAFAIKRIKQAFSI